MKSKEMKALFLAMAFSAATMTACGAYGSMEPQGEDSSSSYSTIENTDSEYSDAQEENLTASEKYQNWDAQKEQRNGYDETSNEEIQYDRIILQLPEYMQDIEKDDNDSLTATAEESDTDFACLKMEHKTCEIPGGDGNFMAPLDEISAEAETDERVADFTNLTAADTEVWVYTSFETINGETTITYTAYFTYPVNDDEADLITVTFTQTGNCEYSYREDFTKMIENAMLVQDYTEE